MLAVPNPATLILLALATACTDGEPPSTDPLDTADTAGTTAACPDGQLDDGGTCVPLACGSGTWGDLAAAPGDVYVQPGGVLGSAGAQGDGSRESPISTIQAAADLAGAAGGGRVILAAGTYVENVTLGLEHAGVRLVGRCRELVFVDGSGIPETPALRLRGEAGVPSFDVEALTLTRATDVGLWVEGAGANVRSVDFDRNTSDGLLARVGAQVRVQGARMTRTRPFEESRYGRGIEASGGSTVTIEDTLVEGNAREGVYVTGADTRVTLVRTTITHSDPTGAQDAGRGIVVREDAVVELFNSSVAHNASIGLDVLTGATALVRDTIFEDNRGSADIYVVDESALTMEGGTLLSGPHAGLIATGGGTDVTLRDVYVADVRATDGSVGGGVLLLDGATALLERTTIVDCQGAGLVLGGERTDVLAQDLTVVGTHSFPSTALAVAVEAYGGARLRLQRCALHDNAADGVRVSGDGTSVDVEDCEISGTSPSNAERSTLAYAFDVESGGSALVQSTHIHDTVGVGMTAFDVGSRLVVVDSTVEATRTTASGMGGFGLDVTVGAYAEVTRTTFAGNASAGLRAYGTASEANVRESEILDTQSTPIGVSGYGVEVGGGALARVSGTRVARNQTLGVSAYDVGTQVILDTSTISDTRALPAGGFGRGINVVDGAVLTATATTIADNQEVGVFVHGASSHVVLDSCQVRGTRRSRTMRIADGVHAQVDAWLEATDTTVTTTEGPAVFSGFGASVYFEGGTLADNTFAGVVALNAAVVVDGTDIYGTTADPEAGGGIGVFATDTYGPSSLTLRNARVGPHPYAGVWLEGEGAHVLDGNDLAGSEGVMLGGWRAHGNAVFVTGGATAWDGTTGVRLDSNTLHDASIAAVLLAGASALVTQTNRFHGNATDLHQQACGRSAPVHDPAPHWEVCAGPSLLTDSSVGLSTLFVPEAEITGE